MGNSFPNGEYVRVGTKGGIQFNTAYIKFLALNWNRRTYTVAFKVGSESGTIDLVAMYGEDGLIKLLRIRFLGPGTIVFDIDKSENNLLSNELEMVDFKNTYETRFVNVTKNLWGGVTKTFVACHVGDNTGSLVVVEQKRNKGVEKPCVVTVTRYCAFRKNSFFRGKTYDPGFSIGVDIRMLNNDFDVSLKSPAEHPSEALFQMFHQVSRTWAWKWTACPHCAAQSAMQPFESENDDQEKSYRPHNKFGGNILANQGIITGNNNGNIFVNQLILGTEE